MLLISYYCIGLLFAYVANRVCLIALYNFHCQTSQPKGGGGGGYGKDIERANIPFQQILEGSNITFVFLVFKNFTLTTKYSEQ